MRQRLAVLASLVLPALIAIGVTGCGPSPMLTGTAAPPADSAKQMPTSTPPPIVQPRPRLTKAPKQAPTERPTTRPPATQQSTTQTPTGVDVWNLAAGHMGPVGPGTKGLIQYRVEVEQATRLNAAGVAAVIDSTLSGARGWTNEGWAFERVTLAAAQVDLVIRLATPKSVDKYCYPLTTDGVVSCRIGKLVMLNLTRWNTGVPDYAGDVGQYRILLVNHEVGHVLKHSDQSLCPGAGLPQPVMMQVYYTGLKGCAKNVWPYAADGTRIG